MKKLTVFIICVIFVLLLAGCGDASEPKVYGEDNKQSEVKQENVTVDLTKMSSTMIYSEVSQMMNNPKDYVGKTVIMNGVYNLFVNQNDESITYSACIVKDATACCSQGLEFVLKEGIEYPQKDSNITVKGRFELYDEDGQQYCHIVDAELL